MLHIINKSLNLCDSLQMLLQQSTSQHTLIFYGEGCYNVSFATLPEIAQQHQVFFLDKDLSARGLSCHWPTLSMAEFVQQVFATNNNTSWF